MWWRCKAELAEFKASFQSIGPEESPKWSSLQLNETYKDSDACGSETCLHEEVDTRNQDALDCVDGGLCHFLRLGNLRVSIPRGSQTSEAFAKTCFQPQRAMASLRVLWRAMQARWEQERLSTLVDL